MENHENGLNISDVIQLTKEHIAKEIEWCVDVNNQCKCKVTKEQAEWFVKGLEQAVRLIDCVADELLND